MTIEDISRHTLAFNSLKLGEICTRKQNNKGEISFTIILKFCNGKVACSKSGLKMIKFRIFCAEVALS